MFLSLAPGLAAGEQDDAEIDPRYGYPVPDAGKIPADLRPDHEVALEITPPDPQAGTPPSFFFEPTGLRVEAGDIVQFTFDTPDHTVTAYHPANGFQRRVPENVPPFSSPVVNVGGAWLYRFDREGVYDAYCGPHHVFGMVMRLVVGELGEDAVPEYEATFRRLRGPAGVSPYSREMLEGELDGFSDRNEGTEWVWLTPAEVLDADALDPTRIQEAGTVPFGAVRDELGGDDNQTTTS
ncbi:cupredoxin domain-containing protein [Halorussus caseinilyticus]|uniref:Plastocyanin/azurin family copper-binding protein n=1 Tax=Halorussus caseinilyticus TaxID=3034025 RepID=A0ABD5WMG4_9EURY